VSVLPVSLSNMFMMKNGHHERAHQLYTDCRTSLVEGPWLMKSSASPADIWLSGTLWSSPAETLDWGKKGGGNTEGAKKNILARFHIFLKSPMLEKPISFVRELVSFRKCFQQILAPTD